MNSRHFITTRYGGIKNAMQRGSQLAAVIHAIDQRIGKDRAYGNRKLVNPFRGIAHTNGSSYSPRYFRHIEGARDGRPTFRLRHIVTTFRIDGFRDINPVPAGFCE